MVLLIVKIFWIWLHNVWYTFSPHMHKAHLYNYWKNQSTVGRMGRRLFQKFVRAGRDGRPWRAAGMDFWNKRHRFLAPIVAEVRQSGPSERTVVSVRDGQLRWTFETNGTDSWRRLFQKSIRSGHGSRPWTDGRDGPWIAFSQTKSSSERSRSVNKVI